MEKGNLITPFISLDDDEQSLLVVRKDWLIYVPIWLKLILGTFFPLGLMYLFTSQLPVYAFFFGYSLYFPFLLLYITATWMDESFDLMLITNKRVVVVSQVRFMVREVLQAPLKQIQNVQVKSPGMWHNLLNYGDLVLETAGNSPNFIMTHVERPSQTADRILKILSHNTAPLTIDTPAH